MKFEYNHTSYTFEFRQESSARFYDPEVHFLRHGRGTEDEEIDTWWNV